MFSEMPKVKSRLLAVALLLSCVELAVSLGFEGTEGSGTGTRNSENDKRIVCYYGSWAATREGDGRVLVEDIDPFLCTHLIYSFVGLDEEFQIKLNNPRIDLEQEGGLNSMGKFVNLKNDNPSLRTLVSVGGWLAPSSSFSKLASNRKSRSKFIGSVIRFLNKHKFDGLDLDWEYPGARGGNSSIDKENFVTLLRELSLAMKPRGYLLSAALLADTAIIDLSYQVDELSKHLDLINLVVYDFHGIWNRATGFNSPLYFRDLGYSNSLSIDGALNEWSSRSSDHLDKINLGLSFYGRSYTLADASMHGLGAKASGPGSKGPFTREDGVLNYLEICRMLHGKDEPATGNWTVVRDEVHQVPYAFKDRQWISFDDEQSIKIKTAYALTKKLGGMMIWSLDHDDVRGNCRSEAPEFPLINAVKSTLSLRSASRQRASRS